MHRRGVINMERSTAIVLVIVMSIIIGTILSPSDPFSCLVNCLLLSLLGRPSLLEVDREQMQKGMNPTTILHASRILRIRQTHKHAALQGRSGRMPRWKSLRGPDS